MKLPVIDFSEKLIHKDGRPSQNFKSFLETLHQSLSYVLRDDGHEIPVRDPDTIAKMEVKPSEDNPNPRYSEARFLVDSDKKAMRYNSGDGTYQTVQSKLDSSFDSEEAFTDSEGKLTQKGQEWLDQLVDK